MVQVRTLHRTTAAPVRRPHPLYEHPRGAAPWKGSARPRRVHNMVANQKGRDAADPPGLTEGEVERLGEGHVLVRDGFLGREQALLCAEAVRAMDRAGATRAARMGRDRVLRPELRGDRLGWLDDRAPSPPLQALYDRFDALRRALNRDAWLGLRGMELQLACYPGGGARYAAHRDALAGDRSRRVTAICYLNPQWNPATDGGALRATTPDGPVELDPILDRLVVFLSDRVEHEVLPTYAPRYAVTAWFRGP